ncbi:MAG: 1,4-alpha-glucan branching protein GlgB, partial [Chitinophagaceae bacterium]|nr:1,4-alpha-glucan branching protein GlgB [Chitinophagaceae bacterium]
MASSKKKTAKTKRYEEVEYVDTSKPVWNYSLLTEDDIRNFQQGTHYRLYEKFGSHSIQVNDQWGMYFCVWAPNATSVSVKGNFNDWKDHEYELNPRWDKSGVWEGFIPGFNLGEVYKYHIVGFKGVETDKGDPFARFWEKRPNTASITWDTSYDWADKEWMKKRKKHNSLEAPWSVYEMHLASWMRPDKNNEEVYNTYDQITERLIP